MTSVFWDNVFFLLGKLEESQKWLADTSKVGKTVINSGIARKSSPSVDNAFKIAQALKTTVEYLVTGKPPEGINPEILAIARKITDLSPENREEVMLVVEYKLKRTGKPYEYPMVTEKLPPYTAPVSPLKVRPPFTLDNNVSFISDKIVYTPFYGQTAAGRPISFDIPPGAVVPWTQALIKGDQSQYYTVQAKGDSMTQAGIENGDYVLLRNTNEPKNNKIMLVRHENESTLKRIKIKSNQEIYMCWEDGSGKEPVRLDDQDYEIQGEFVGIMRG